MMCAEGLWWGCHRRLISDALTARGWLVVQIGRDANTAEHELTPFAVVQAASSRTDQVQASLGSS